MGKAIGKGHQNQREINERHNVASLGFLGLHLGTCMKQEIEVFLLHQHYDDKLIIESYIITT